MSVNGPFSVWKEQLQVAGSKLQALGPKSKTLNDVMLETELSFVPDHEPVLREEQFFVLGPRLPHAELISASRSWLWTLTKNKEQILAVERITDVLLGEQRTVQRRTSFLALSYHQLATPDLVSSNSNAKPFSLCIQVFPGILIGNYS